MRSRSCNIFHHKEVFQKAVTFRKIKGENFQFWSLLNFLFWQNFSNIRNDLLVCFYIYWTAFFLQWKMILFPLSLKAWDLINGKTCKPQEQKWSERSCSGRITVWAALQSFYQLSAAPVLSHAYFTWTESCSGRSDTRRLHSEFNPWEQNRECAHCFEIKRNYSNVRSAYKLRYTSFELTANASDNHWMYQLHLLTLI